LEYKDYINYLTSFLFFLSLKPFRTMKKFITLGLFMLLLLVGLTSAFAAPPQPDFPALTATYSNPATVVAMQVSLTSAQDAALKASSTQGFFERERRSPNSSLITFSTSKRHRGFPRHHNIRACKHQSHMSGLASINILTPSNLSPSTRPGWQSAQLS
jgi:hypothetical protein